MNPDDHASALLTAITRSLDQTSQALPDLAARIQNWDAVIALAFQHGMLPRLHLRLHQSAVLLPENARLRLQSAFNQNSILSLRNAAELIRVLECFQQNRIDALPFKGVVLAVASYGDLAARPAGDLDILIHYRDLLRATALLRAQGYKLITKVLADGTPEATDYFEYHFERPSDNMVIELRWRLELTQPRFRRDLGLDWAWRNRSTALLAGAQVPDMDPETRLIVLAMHGSKHIWSRLIWILDVAQAISASPNLDWHRAQTEARQQGLWKPLAIGVLLAHHFSACAVPEFVLHRFRRDPEVLHIVRHVQENLFRAPGAPPTGRVPYNVQLLDTRDRIRLVFSFNFLRPNERDRAFVRLPRWLSPLYFVLRPLRILRDRSAR